MAFRKFHRDTRGAALMEFAIVATVFLTLVFGIIEFGRLLWTHNALKSAAQQGARYATLRKSDAASITAVKNVVVYGDPNPPGGAQPSIPGLTTSKVNVTHANFNGLQLSAKATVTITGYQFTFSVPLIGSTITLPDYKTVMTGESAGYVPCDIPNATPHAPCNIIPN